MMVDPLSARDAATGSCEAPSVPVMIAEGAPFCGIAAAAALLGDTWTLLLVRDLAAGPRRFTELQASTGISVRVLTDRLRMMAQAGLVTRSMFNEIPPRVEYTLTLKGQDIVPVLDALRAYGEKWLRPLPIVE